MKPAMTAAEIADRLAHASSGASLDPARRLETKIDLRAVAIAARLRTASELHELCVSLGRLGRGR